MSELFETDFAAFWARYPKKVARLYAEKCYRTARKRASHAEIMAGLERYIGSKPGWQAWAHASSWLNAGRWMDELEVSKIETRPRYHCDHDPRCANPGNWQCQQRTVLEQARKAG